MYIYIYIERERERERESLVSDVDKRPRVGNRIGRVMPTEDSTSDLSHAFVASGLSLDTRNKYPYESYRA